MKNDAFGAAWSLMFEALAKAYGANDAKRIAEETMEKFGSEVPSEQTAAEIIAHIFLAGEERGEAVTPEELRRETIKHFAICAAVLSEAGNAYHVIAAHQTAEDKCQWPVCKNVRETQAGTRVLIEALVAKPTDG